MIFSARFFVIENEVVIMEGTYYTNFQEFVNGTFSKKDHMVTLDNPSYDLIACWTWICYMLNIFDNNNSSYDEL